MPIAALLRLLVGLLAPAFDMRRITDTAGRMAMAGVLMALAILALVAAIGWMAAALWVYAAPWLGSAGASLAVAGAFVTLSLFLLLGAWLAMNVRKSKPAPPPQSADALLGMMGTLFSQHKAATLVAALLAGMAAESLRRRD